VSFGKTFLLFVLPLSWLCVFLLCWFISVWDLDSEFSLLFSLDLIYRIISSRNLANLHSWVPLLCHWIPFVVLNLFENHECRPLKFRLVCQLDRLLKHFSNLPNIFLYFLSNRLFVDLLADYLVTVVQWTVCTWHRLDLRRTCFYFLKGSI
jgi:hypothetical protein